MNYAALAFFTALAGGFGVTFFVAFALSFAANSCLTLAVQTPPRGDALALRYHFSSIRM